MGGILPRTALQNPWGCVTLVAMGIIGIGISRKLKASPSTFTAAPIVDEISFTARAVLSVGDGLAKLTIQGEASSGNEQ